MSGTEANLPAEPADRWALIEAAVADWLSAKGSRSDHTMRTYRDALARAARDLDIRTLARVTPGQAAALYRQWCDRYDLATANQTVSALSSFWRDQADAGRLPLLNPWVGFKRKKPPLATTKRVLSEDEVRRFFAAAPPGPERICTRFLYFTGARISGALALRWEDFREDANGVLVQLYEKGSRSRTVRVHPTAWAELQPLRAGKGRHDHVWDFSRQHAWHYMQKVAHRAGLADRIVSPHVLRHSHATHALAHGANLLEIQRNLGHKQLDTTRIYIDLSPGKGSEAYLPDDI